MIETNGIQQTFTSDEIVSLYANKCDPLPTPEPEPEPDLVTKEKFNKISA